MHQQIKLRFRPYSQLSRALPLLLCMCASTLAYAASAPLTPAQMVERGIDPAQADRELEALKHCDADQASLHICASAEQRRLDNELNRLYQQQMARLADEPADAQALRQAQRAWLKYVEADCLYQNGPSSEGGSIWPMLNVQCWTQHLKPRIELLRSYVNCTQDGCKGN